MCIEQGHTALFLTISRHIVYVVVLHIASKHSGMNFGHQTLLRFFCYDKLPTHIKYRIFFFCLILVLRLNN